MKPFHLQGSPRTMSASEEKLPECTSSLSEQVPEELVELSDQNNNSDDEYLSAEDDEELENIDLSDVKQSDLPRHTDTNERLSSTDHVADHSKEDDGCEDIAQDDSEDEDGDASEEETDEVEEDAQVEEDELKKRLKLEEDLTEEEKEERKRKSQELKDEGNIKFRNSEFDEALEAYSQALSICPLVYAKERSIMFSNRAACKMKKELYDSAIKDSSSALELHPTYLKALLRRAELYEKTEKLEEALADYQKVLELDMSNGMARAACMRLPQQIKDRNEKMKEEMIGKLKDLGNLVLRPFGLSTNNFKMQQDPNTGSYSMQFQQNPPGNGT